MKRLPWAVAASLACVAAVALAGCGAGTSSASSGGGKQLTLDIGIGSSSTNYGAFWVAQANDLFAKNGVKVNVVSYQTASTTATVVASGQVQLQLFTAPLGLQLALQGKPISIIDELSTFNASSMAIMGAKDIKSFDDLRSASHCRIATVAQGTVPYAYAARYKDVQGLDNCDIITQDSNATVLASVASGFAQAGVLDYSTVLTAVDAGKVNMLVDPLHVPADLAEKLSPMQYPSFVVFGLRETIEKNKDAVTRFLKALREGNAMLLKMTPQELGKATAPLPGFGGAPASLLGNAWAGTMSQIPTGDNAGFISEADWNAALKGFDGWGLPSYDPSSSKVSYNEAVDMDYFNDAG